MNSTSATVTTEIYRIGTDIVFCADVDDLTAHKLIRLIKEAIIEIQDAVKKATADVGKDSKVVSIVAKPITLYLTTEGGATFTDESALHFLRTKVCSQHTLTQVSCIPHGQSLTRF